jgi:hypothetical protein
LVVAPRAGARLAEPRAGCAANRKSSSSAAERSFGSGAFDPAASAAARSLGDERTGDLPETTPATGDRPAMGAGGGAAGAASSSAFLFLFAARRGDARTGVKVVLFFSFSSPRFPSSRFSSFASNAVGVA